MEGADTLFGYPIPFPKSDLITALVAVCAFLPTVAIVHLIIAKVAGLFKKEKTQ